MPSEDFFSQADAEPAAEREAFDQLFSVVYEQLRRLAHAIKQNDGSMTLNPTALVNETWIRLAQSPGCANTSPAHFVRIAGRAMREVLVEAARRRVAGKRGGRIIFVPINDAVDFPAGDCAADLLRLDEALRELEVIDQRRALIVDSRFFGGFAISAIADMLEVSETTVNREWRVARAWLASRMNGHGAPCPTKAS